MEHDTSKWKEIIFGRVDEDPVEGYLNRMLVRPDVKDIVQAVKNAAYDYLHTPAGWKYFRGEGYNFNMGDAMMIPTEITAKHGFIIGDTLAADVTVDQNQSLVPDDLEDKMREERGY